MSEIAKMVERLQATKVQPAKEDVEAYLECCDSLDKWSIEARDKFGPEMTTAAVVSLSAHLLRVMDAMLEARGATKQ